MKRNTEQVASEWLVINIQLGDERAKDTLFSLWYPKLLRYAKNQLQDRELAAEAVQNTLLIASRKLHSLRDATVFPAWVYKILQAQGIDLIRGRQRATRAQKTLEIHNDDQHESESSEFEIDFARALSGLEVDLYQTVHLHYLEGFNQSETARILDIPEGTVKSRLFTARNQLKQFLRGEGYE